MKCRAVRELLGAYLDSELEASKTVDVNRHLDGCAACRARFDAERRIEVGATEALRSERGDEQEVFEAALDAVCGTRVPRRSRRLWIAAAAVFAVAAVAWSLRSGTPEFVNVAAADHGKYRAGIMGPHVETSVAGAVRDYLEPRVGVPVGLLPEGAPWRIRGPRLCYLKTVAVGLVMLERGGTPVSLFVARAEDAAKFGDALPREVRAFTMGVGNAAIVECDGVVRCAVGDVPKAELERLVAGY